MLTCLASSTTTTTCRRRSQRRRCRWWCSSSAARCMGDDQRSKWGQERARARTYACTWTGARHRDLNLNSTPDSWRTRLGTRACRTRPKVVTSLNVVRTRARYVKPGDRRRRLRLLLGVGLGLGLLNPTAVALRVLGERARALVHLLLLLGNRDRRERTREAARHLVVDTDADARVHPPRRSSPSSRHAGTGASVATVASSWPGSCTCHNRSRRTRSAGGQRAKAHECRRGHKGAGGAGARARARSEAIDRPRRVRCVRAGRKMREE